MEYLFLFFLLAAMGFFSFRTFFNKKKTEVSKIEETALAEKEKAFNRIHEWIMDDKQFLNSDLKLEKVAKGVHLSEKQVSSAINTIACQNFNAYINKLRIKEAQSLLNDTSFNHYTVDAIAEMVGFANKVSFYKAFKKVTGQSPTDFRKSLKQSDH